MYFASLGKIVLRLYNPIIPYSIFMTYQRMSYVGDYYYRNH